MLLDGNKVNLETRKNNFCHCHFIHFMMKFGSVFVSFISFIFTASALDYKFLRMENCSSSDNSVASIEDCSINATRMNMVFNIKKPLNKFYVRVENMYIKKISNFSSSARLRFVVHKKFRTSLDLQYYEDRMVCADVWKK